MPCIPRGVSVIEPFSQSVSQSVRQECPFRDFKKKNYNNKKLMILLLIFFVFSISAVIWKKYVLHSLDEDPDRIIGRELQLIIYIGGY